MTVIRPDILAVRSLQATRRTHLPTYVASRYLADSVVGSEESIWARATLTRKYPLRSQGQFLKAEKFKKKSANGELEYRELHIPSPTTLLTESLVLGYLAGSPSFAKKSCVYSYLWSSDPKCPFNFEHYVNGYKARNKAIEKLLMADRSRMVIISDIEKFYPNIDQERVRKRFRTALAASDIPGDIKETADHLVDHLFSSMPGNRGVVTGPELSHVMGDLALAEIDKELSKKFPDGYFRYVDDIVLAVPGEKQNDATQILRELAEHEGLTVHPKKMDVLPADEWIKHGPHHMQKVRENSFEALVFLIKVYLLQHTGREADLRRGLEDNGFSIPIDRLAWKSQDRLFSRRLWRLVGKRWGVAIRALVAREQDIIKQAHIVRDIVRKELVDLLGTDIPRGPTRRKWYVQQLRYLTNRAFYLFPVNDLEFLVEPLSRFDEFAETVALLRLLLHGEIKELLLMPGAAVIAGASFLRQKDQKLPRIDSLDSISLAVIESLAVLLLFGVVEVTPNFLEKLDDNSRQLLLFCGGATPDGRIRNDFSYIDEIRSLQVSRKREDAIAAIESRFSDSEEAVLDALDIGGQYGY